MKSRLRKGEIAEALFVAKALSLGMNVSKPFGQNCRYDFIVETMGRAVRVQVKSTWQRRVSSFESPVSRKLSAPSARLRAGSRRQERQYVIRAGGTTTRGARRYQEDEVDHIAAYVGPEDEWYVIPVGKIPSAFTIVLPGRYGRYREAWDQLCPRGVVVGDIKACADPAAQSVTAEDAEDTEEDSCQPLRLRLRAGSRRQPSGKTVGERGGWPRSSNGVAHTSRACGCG